MSDVENESKKQAETEAENESKETEKKGNFESETFAANASLQQMYAEKWIDISLDTDRQLLTLSTAAIGLLATFINNKGAESTFQLLLLIFSVIAFGAVIGALLYIFKLNRNFILIQSTGKQPDESLMLFLDKWVRYLFFFGIICTSIYTLNFAIQQFETNLIKKGEVVNESKATGKSEKPSGGDKSSSDGQRSGGPTGNQREPSGNEKPSSNSSSDANSTASEHAGSTK